MGLAARANALALVGWERTAKAQGAAEGDAAVGDVVGWSIPSRCRRRAGSGFGVRSLRCCCWRDLLRRSRDFADGCEGKGVDFGLDRGVKQSCTKGGQRRACREAE
jgi:hypothetical protein